MHESQSLNIGAWYYIDRLAGVTQEEVMALNQQRVVVRDRSGNLSTIEPVKVIAQSPKPHSVCDVVTPENTSLVLAAVLIAASFFHRN